MNVTDVQFNGASLNDIITIYNLDLNKYPKFEIREYKIARADKSIITSKEAVDKEITILGSVCGVSRPVIEEKFLLLKLALLGVNGQLTVFQAGGEVIYTATCDQIEHRWNRSKLDVEIKLTASDPYGKLQPLTTLDFPNITTAQSNFTLEASSVTTIRPAITLTYNSVTGGTNKTVTVRNETTQIGISINEDFATGDVLYIDSENLIVTLNGAAVDFSGSFPIFQPTLTGMLTPEVAIAYGDDFTNRDVDGIFTYNVGV